MSVALFVLLWAALAVLLAARGWTRAWLASLIAFPLLAALLLLLDPSLQGPGARAYRSVGTGAAALVWAAGALASAAAWLLAGRRQKPKP